MAKVETKLRNFFSWPNYAHKWWFKLFTSLIYIKSFERWSRHDEMTPYVSVLEEWDDLVGEDWE